MIRVEPVAIDFIDLAVAVSNVLKITARKSQREFILLDLIPFMHAVNCEGKIMCFSIMPHITDYDFSVDNILSMISLMF